MSQIAVVQTTVAVPESNLSVNSLLPRPQILMSKNASPVHFDSACLELENLSERLSNLVRSKSAKRFLLAPEDDLFARGVSVELQDFVLFTAFSNPLHQFQLLTTQPERAFQFLTNEKLLPRLEKIQQKLAAEKKTPTLFTAEKLELPLSNLLIGTKIENQKQATERRPALQEIAAAGWKTWLSYDAIAPVSWSGEWKFLRWLVIGGESDKLSRPVHPNWLRAARDFAGKYKKVAFFFKGWGDWLPKQVWEEMNPKTYGAKKWNQFDWGIVTQTGDYHSYSLPNPRRSKDECLVLKIGKSKTGNTLDGETFNQIPD